MFRKCEEKSIESPKAPLNRTIETTQNLKSMWEKAEGKHNTNIFVGLFIGFMQNIPGYVVCV